MPPASVSSLVEDIRQRQLLEPEQVSHLVQDLQTRFTDPRALAHHLLQRSWLTPYQANQLLQGLGAGLVLGQYRLLERLGEGGMGQVFKARHQGLGRLVALKVIRKDRLTNADAIRRFHREIHAASKLSHPNVVIAFDADAIDGVHFFAMEYVPGPDLTQVIQTRGMLPADLACEYVRQASLGLQHAHERGLIHRDIKPSNLLVIESKPGNAGPLNPVVKILDMGLVRLALEDDASMISQDGLVMGTPDFMAPEQAKNSHKVDHRADIYSLGCTLYYLLTGKVPFPGGSNIEKLLHHQTDEPTPIAEFRTDVPAGVRDAVRWLMAKRPEDRPATAAAAAALLAPWCPGATPRPVRPIHAVTTALPGPATIELPGARPVRDKGAPTLVAPTEKRPWSRMRSGILALGFVGACVVLIACGVYFALSATKTPATTNSQVNAATLPRLTEPAPLPSPPKPSPTERKHLPEAWARVLPDRTTLLVTANVAELKSSPFFHEIEDKLPEEYGSLKLGLLALGVDLNKNVERVALALSPAADGKPASQRFVVFQGAFNAGVVQKLARLDGWKQLPGSRETVYRVDKKNGPSEYVALVGDHLLIISSAADDAVAAFEKANNTNPRLENKPVRQFLEARSMKEGLVALFVGGDFVSPDASEPVSLRNQIKIRHIHGSLRLDDSGKQVRARVVFDLEEGTPANLPELLHAGLQKAKADNPLGRFVHLMTKNNPKVEPGRIQYSHNFGIPDIGALFAKGP